MRDSTIAIEVENADVWHLLCGLVPHFNELNEAENIGNFVIPGPNGAWSIASPGTVAEQFDHVAPHKLKVKTVILIAK